MLSYDFGHGTILYRGDRRRASKGHIDKIAVRSSPSRSVRCDWTDRKGISGTIVTIVFKNSNYFPRISTITPYFENRLLESYLNYPGSMFTPLL